MKINRLKNRSFIEEINKYTMMGISSITILFCCFINLSLTGCQLKQSSDNKHSECTDSILQIKGEKRLLMDNADYPTFGHIRYYERNGNSYLVQGNENQRTISVYDYQSGKKTSESSFEGANGEFFAYNADTAFVISNRNHSTIYFWNKGTTIDLKVPVKVRAGQVEQFPRCTLDGGVNIGGKWYFSCFRLGEYPNEMQSGKDRFPLLEVDLERGSSRFLGEYPNLYAQNNMGTLNYWVPNLCSERIGDKLLIGFKASPDMLLLNPSSGESHFVSVKSIYADTIPLPLTAKGRDYLSDDESYYNFAQYSHYDAICYDRWRKIYYRFVGIGLNDWTLAPSPLLQTKKKWSVMVFDEAFHKLGEQYLGDAYQIDQHFVSPEGLYIQKKTENDSVAVYTLFEYINK